MASATLASCASAKPKPAGDNGGSGDVGLELLELLKPFASSSLSSSLSPVGMSRKPKPKMVEFMDEMDKPLVLRILADEVRRWVDDEVDISLLLDGIRIGVVAMVGLRAASFSDAGVDGASDADAADDALFRRHLSNFCHGLACSLPVLVPASDWAAVVVELVAGRILLCKKNVCVNVNVSTCGRV